MQFTLHSLIIPSSFGNCVQLVFCYILIGLHTPCRYIRLLFFLSPLFPHWSPCTIWIWSESPVRYDLTTCDLYDINIRAMDTTILSIRGVTIPIYFVNSTTDSIRWCVVLFKPVTILTSDSKSEFLCQSSSSVQNLQTPLNHLICLGYLPHPCHHVSPIHPQTQCSHRVPQAEVALTACQMS